MSNKHGRGLTGPAALLLAGLACGGLVAGGLAGNPAAQAQSTGDLRYRLDVLGAELADIRARLGGVPAAPGTGGVPAGVLSNSNVNELEGELRRLTAAVEEMQHQVRRIGEEAARRFSDIEFRLTELEGGDIGALQPVPPLGGVGSAATPAPTPAPAPSPGPTGSQPGSQGQSGSQGQTGFQQPASGIVSGPSGQGGFTGLEVPLGQSGQSGAGGQQVAAVSASERGDLDRAVQDVRQGRFDQAEDRLRKFLNQYPSSPLTAQAWYWLGESQFVRGNHSEAARSFLNGYNAERTGQRAPHNLYRLGVTLGRLGQRNEACLTLREVRSQFPGAPDGIVEQADAEADALACG